MYVILIIIFQISFGNLTIINTRIYEVKIVIKIKFFFQSKVNMFLNFNFKSLKLKLKFSFQKLFTLSFNSKAILFKFTYIVV